MSSRDLMQQDLMDTLVKWIDRNKDYMTEILIYHFKQNMTDMVKAQITNAIRYYSAEASNAIDLGLNGKILDIIKVSFGDELQKEAKRVVDERVGSEKLTEKVEDMIDIALEKDLRRFMQREIKARISDMVNNKELKITI